MKFQIFSNKQESTNELQVKAAMDNTKKVPLVTYNPPDKEQPGGLAKKSTCYKIVWVLLFLVSIIMFIVQASILLEDYFSYPTQTTLASEDIAEFPAVTLCSLRHIDPVLTFLLIKAYKKELPETCDNTDDMICALKEKYKEQLETYDLLVKSYEKMNETKYMKWHGARSEMRNMGYTNDFVMKSAYVKFTNRVTFASNIERLNRSTISDFGVQFSHLFTRCFYSMYECAELLSTPCLSSQSNNELCKVKFLYHPNIFPSFLYVPPLERYH